MLMSLSSSFWLQSYAAAIQGVFTLLAAAAGVWIGALLGLRAYFRQKEYELVKERYLDGALDIVAAEFEHAMETFHHNWARCLHLLKMYRDFGEGFDEESTEFLESRTAFHRIAQHRIEELIGSKVIWQVYQSALSFSAAKNYEMTKEFTNAIRRHRAGELNMSLQEFVDNARERLEELNAESHRYAHLTRTFYVLSRALEKERMTFEGVAEFRGRPDIKESLAALETAFEDKLKEDEEGEGEGPATPEARVSAQQGIP